MTFRRSRTSLLGQKKVASDLTTTSEKIETSSCFQIFLKIFENVLSKVLWQFHNQNKKSREKTQGKVPLTLCQVAY